MKNLKALPVLVLIAALLIIGGWTDSKVSAASWRNMEIYNNTGYTIHRLYISARGNSSWGNDLLGDDVLYNGGVHSIRYDANYQYYELMVVLADGSKREWRGDHALNFKGSTMLVFSDNGDGSFRAKVD